MNYTITHLHSDLSNGTTNIDSITKFDDYINKAKECGMKAICFTEHGNVFQWVMKKQHIEAAGLKYIHGIEAYITGTLNEKVRDNYHCVLIAKNYEGVKEINKLSTISYNRSDNHFYYAPRISINELINTSDNIIVTTACLGGILNNGNNRIKDKFIDFLRKNKHRCFLEIQHHNVEDQIKYNQYLYNLSKEINVPLIVGTDTHALNKEHLEGRSILQKAKNVRFANEESWDLTFKTYDELISVYKLQNSLPMDVVQNAIENTNKVADMVEEFTLDKSYKYPHLWDNPLKTFKEEITKGAKRRGIYSYPNFKEYKKRINYEMKAYIHNDAIDFMLLMTDIIKFCNDNGIKVGYGRGSVNGSVIAWLLGITEMDSIKHGLNFDRFMNVERVSLSDIDTDFPPSDIEKVKQYIFNKKGLYCSDIVTFNTIADKGAVRDVGRALDMPLSEVDKICSALDDKDSVQYLKEKYPVLFKYVDLVKGVIVSVGSHPCGLIVSPCDITYEFGTFTTTTSNYPISQINMKEVDSLNYVKLDLLKLDTIEVINKTCELAGIERLTPDNVDIYDDKVWNSIRDDTTGIFQWEGNTGNTYIKKLLSDTNIKKLQTANENLDKMTLLSIGNSAIRPAGASYREDLANGVVRKIGAAPIDEFLSNTFGYLVFQEQIIFFLHLYCGFTMGESDVVRRGFAKKTGTEKYIPIIKDGGYLTDNSTHYIKGYVKTMKEKYDIDEEKSEQDILAFIKVIEDASSYLFSLNHSQPYSYEGYVSGYLRYYYPYEFLTVSLEMNKDKEEKTKALSMYAKNIGIKILPPKFRYSKVGYFFNKDEHAIYKGIGSIKYMNDKVADELYDLRNEQYNSFIDLLKDIENKTSLNSRQLDILISMNFFEEFGTVGYLNKVLAIYNLFNGKKEVSKKKLEENGIPIETVAKYGNETVKKVNKLDTNNLIIELISNIPQEKLNLIQQITNEHEILGIISSYDPSVNKRLYFVSSCEVKKTITNISLYEIYSGKTRKVKIWTSQYNRNPFEEKDVLYVISLEKKNKKEPTGEINPATGKKIYCDVEGEYEYWLKDFSIKKDIENEECIYD